MKKSSPTTLTSKRRLPAGSSGLRAYFDRRRQTFGAALSAARSYYAVEGIHDLRVEVKRLRALYRLTASLAPSFTSKPSANALRELFRAAGRLRDIDIHQATALRHLKRLDLREYFNHLKAEELALRDRFAPLAALDHARVLATSGVKASAAVSGITDAQMRKRMLKRVRKLTAKLDRLIMKRQQGNDALHAVRKRSKALRYTLDIWQQCFGPSRYADAATKRLKDTYNALGEWHDTLLTLESVRRFVKRQSANGVVDATAYRKFEQGLQIEADRLLTVFRRGKKPLHGALERLARECQQQHSQPKSAARRIHAA